MQTLDVGELGSFLNAMWLQKLIKQIGGNATPEGSVMKDVSYRGGLVTFSIPSNWIEEYDEQGGGTFFEDSLDSGTLRLNVITLASSEESEKIDVDREVKVKAKENGGIAMILDEGNALVRYDSHAVENGEDITVRYWNVYNPVPPNHLRIAVFSYTLLSSQLDRPEYLQELEMLDSGIAKIRFATGLGVTN